MTEASIPRSADLQFLQGEKANRLNLQKTVRGGFESVPVTPFSFEVEILGSNKDTEDLWERRWDELKEERNGLTALFTEQVWHKVNGIRSKVIEKGHPLGLLSGLAEFPVRDDPVPLGTTNPSKLTPDYLRRATFYTFFAGVQSWKQERDQRLLLPQEEQTIADERYERLNKIIWYGNQTGKVARDSATFIGSGIGTAMETEWGLFEVLPKVFKRKYGIDPSRDDMGELIQTTHLVVPMAAGHEDITIPLLDFLRGFKFSEQRMFNESFLEEYFDIAEERVPSYKGSHIVRNLVITDAARQEFIKKMAPDPKKPNKKTLTNLSSVTTGCVGLATRVTYSSPRRGIEISKNVVVATHEWCEDIAAEYYLPQFAAA